MLCKEILKAERAANKRYRNKINLLRSVFLEDESDEKIQDYITKHKKIGIKLSGDEIEELGSTLPKILRLLDILQYSQLPVVFVLMAKLVLNWNAQ